MATTSTRRRWFAAAPVGLFQGFRQSGPAHRIRVRVTGAIEQLTGRHPRSLADLLVGDDISRC